MCAAVVRATGSGGSERQASDSGEDDGEFVPTADVLFSLRLDAR